MFRHSTWWWWSSSSKIRTTTASAYYYCFPASYDNDDNDDHDDHACITTKDIIIAIVILDGWWWWSLIIMHTYDSKYHYCFSVPGYMRDPQFLQKIGFFLLGKTHPVFIAMQTADNFIAPSLWHCNHNSTELGWFHETWLNPHFIWFSSFVCFGEAPSHRAVFVFNLADDTSQLTVGFTINWIWFYQKILPNKVWIANSREKLCAQACRQNDQQY